MAATLTAFDSRAALWRNMSYITEAHRQSIFSGENERSCAQIERKGRSVRQTLEHLTHLDRRDKIHAKK